MSRLPILAMCAASALLAQPVVAPSEAQRTGPVKTIGGYDVLQSWEVGYRYHDVSGNRGKYRSDVNFGNGVRLLGSNVSLHSREGRGKYFDELLLNTLGLAGDPYQFSSFRLRKNKLYSYDLVWRQQDYHNPALTIAGGQHLLNTTRRLQDHTLVLLPQSPFRAFFGFAQAKQNGAGLSTANLFGGSTGDEFPLFADVRRRQNEFRFGFEVRAVGAKLTVMRVIERFRDDTRRTSGANPGNNPLDPLTLESFRRDEPYHGDSGTWRTNLVYDRSETWSLNARLTRAVTERNFIFDESTTGTDRFGPVRNRQVLVFGDGRRPVTTGTLTLSFFPADKVTVSNHTAYHDFRMEGDGRYSELDNGTLDFRQTNFGFLGIRTVVNSTDLQVRPTRRFSTFGGYSFSARRIRSVEQVSFDDVPDRVAAEQENRLHSVRAGVRFDPLIRKDENLFIVIDGELGRADRPFYPTSERDYHALGGRIQYRHRKSGWTASAHSRANYNFNSASLLSHSSRSRIYAADVSYMPPGRRFSLDAGYSKLHQDTLTGIAYFFNRVLTADRSAYGSNIHSAHAMLRLPIGAAADLMVGYTRVQDRGDKTTTALARPFIPGRSTPVLPPGQLAVSSWPLTYESPMARLTVRPPEAWKSMRGVRLNFGYQFYRYREVVLPEQDYRAHTGFSSLSWVF